MGDQFKWNLVGSGIWTLPSNWIDLTTGANPATTAPSSGDSVAIPAPTSAFDVITGPGNAASLLTTGDVALSGSFATGSLVVGTTSAASTLDLFSGTRLTDSGNATVASGSLQDNGATLSVAGTLTLGATTGPAMGTAGALAVSNHGSAQLGDVVLTGGLAGINPSVISVDSTSIVEIGNAGTGAAGTVTVDSGATLSGSGSITALAVLNNGTLSGVSAGTITNNGLISNATLITGTNNGTVVGGSLSGIVNNGNILTGTSGTISVRGVTGSGLLEIEHNGVLTAGSGVTDQVTFLDNTGTFDFGTGGSGDNPASTLPIAGFATGDVIVYKNVIASAATYTSTGANTGDLVLINNGSNVGTLTLLGNYTGDVFIPTASSSGLFESTSIALVACFLRGTRIATPSGETAVEDLTTGDMVVTIRGEVRKVVWIGIGQVMVAHGQRSAATPVIVRKGALDENVPHRDLEITKGHSLHIDGVLIPVEYLVNHRSILWDDQAREVTVYHIELETHDVLLANGAPAESYRDDGNRWLFHNGNSGWDLPPLEPCAPVLTGGPVVDTIWRRLLDRSGRRLNLATTDKPDLHLLVDGRRVDGQVRSNGIHVFRLAKPPVSVRVMSRAGRQDELGLARDPRLLGVALRQIMLWQGRRLTVIGADSPELSEGFHEFEPENDFRWTDGSGLLPGFIFADLTGPSELELDVGCTTSYPVLSATANRKAA